MLNTAGISFNDQWYSSQYLQFKIEMHFSSRYCYMFSSDQVYVTSQTKRYLTSIDRLCLHVTHSFALIYPFSPWVSRSLFSLSSLQLWMFVQMEWNHQDEKISLRSLPSILVGFTAPPPSFHFLWLYIFLSDLLLLLCYSLTLESGGQKSETTKTVWDSKSN